MKIVYGPKLYDGFNTLLTFDTVQGTLELILKGQNFVL